jgi:aspartate--ammonia ligase
MQQFHLLSPYAMDGEIVQSLAKWKRIMLDRLDIPVNEGIFCDSTSIRKGYKGDVTHSVIADQWDFEIRITKEQRVVDALQNYVRTIYKIITDAEDMILDKYADILGPQGHPTTSWRLPKNIRFTTPDNLHAEFPGMDVHDRETAAVRKYGAIFVMGMGWPLSDGSPSEEVRSPGYDDWNLNGDIIVMHPLTEYRLELSSMGIRVDKHSLLRQLEHRGVLHEANLDYQKAVIEELLPFSYGGGIGISRLLMLLLRTCHIGEVQVGLWHDAPYKQATDAGIDMIPD